MQSPGLPPPSTARRIPALDAPGTARSRMPRSVLKRSVLERRVLERREGAGSAGGPTPCPLGQAR